MRPGWDEAPPPPPKAAAAPGIMDRKRPVRLNEDQRKELLAIHRNNPKIKRAELARRFNVHVVTVRTIIKQMEERERTANGAAIG